MSQDDTKKPDYEVGRGRPPKGTRFRPGQSGNPRGRPKKSRNLNTLLQRELDRLVDVKEGGKKLRISKREAIIKQIVNGAIKGSPKQLQVMMSYLENQKEPPTFQSTVADDLLLLKYLPHLASDDDQESNDDKD